MPLVACKSSDRVKETSTTTGTGNLTLAGAATGFESFNTAFGTDVRFFYAIVLQSGSEWEVGQGYLSASTTLVRETILQSSNSDAAVNFSSGTKDVFQTFPGRIADQVIPRGRVMALANQNWMP